MDKNQILALAKEAGFNAVLLKDEPTVVLSGSYGQMRPITGSLVKFAALIAAAEQERCIKIMRRNNPCIHENIGNYLDDVKQDIRKDKQ